MNLNDWVRKPINEDEFVSLKPFADFRAPEAKINPELEIPTVTRQAIKKATDEGGQ